MSCIPLLKAVKPAWAIIIIIITNNNHIRGTGIGGKGKHKKSGVTVLRKFSMNGDRSYTGAAGTISDH